MDISNGKVTAILGQVIEVEFEGELPKIHDILVLEENNLVKMEVYSSSSPSSFYCLLLTFAAKFSRGSRVISTGTSITIPVGTEVLGRVMNVFGEPQDGKGQIKAQSAKSIFTQSIPLAAVIPPSKVLE